MTRFAESYAVWLADYYLLAAVLLGLALVAAAVLRQPAQRLMVTKSTLIALGLLAILCALPGWSVVHLLTAEQSPATLVPVREEPAEMANIVARPYLPPSNSVQQPMPPALAPQIADEDLTIADAPKISWAAWLAIAHLAGMGCIVVWLALGWAASLRLRRLAQAAPASVCGLLNEFTKATGQFSKSPRLLTHDRIDVAVALGVWRSIILLPTAWPNSQSPDRLRAVLAHESTHILNHDLQWVALARILFIALWANPLFWLMKRRLRLDQEALADAAAAQITSRQQYAEQLVAWARDARSRPSLHLSSAVGLWEGPSQLRQRIAILLDEQLTVLRNCSRSWRFASLAVCALLAGGLSLLTLQPGQSAPPPDENKMSNSDAERVELAIKVLRETDGTGTRTAQMDLGDRQFGRISVNDDWADAVRTLVQIGKPAVPAIATALDEEDRNHPIRKLAFTLRAIGDPRAVPALIRALPRTLVPSCSDCAEYVEDPELLKFMQKHDLNAGESGNTFSYGRPFREVVDALRKLSGTNQNDMELNFIFLGTTPVQRDAQRMLFYDLAQRWEKWWSQNWQRLGVGKEYAAVNLSPPKLELSAADVAARTPTLPTGSKLGLVGGMSGTIIQSAQESKQRCFIDFDTGRETGWPKELPPFEQLGANQQPIVTWADKQGIDLMGITYQPPGYDAPIYCLQPLGMKVWQLTPEERRFLTKAIMGEIPYPLGHPVDRLVPRKEAYEGPDKNELGGTAFLFLTREGTAGLLRMTAQVTDTNMQRGKRSSPDDQFSPTGYYRGAKISYTLIGEVPDPAVRRVGESRLILGGGPPPATELKPAAGTKDGWTPLAANTGKQKGTSHTDPPRQEPNTVSGRAVGEKGQPVAGAEIFLFRVNTRDGTRKLLGQKSTNADGQFRFDNVIDIQQEFPDRKFPSSNEPGDEMLQGVVRAPGRISQFWLMMTQLVAQVGDYQQVQMLASASLRGTVTDANGKPVAGALVSLGTGNFQRWEGANASRTDATGNFKIDDLAPYNSAELEKQIAEQKRQLKEQEAKGNRLWTSFLSHPELTVEHPDYAVKHTSFESAPGTKDVQLDPAASLEGRVVFADSGKPAVGVLVGAGTSVADRGPPTAALLREIVKVAVRTDANGKYRMTNLPAGKYDLWAETPNWINEGLHDVNATPGKTGSVFDLKFTKGGVVSAGLVDAKTREPIAVQPSARAYFLIRPVSQHPTVRPELAPFITANSEGRFELNLIPGRTLIGAGGVEIGGTFKYSGPPTTEVTAVDGQTIRVDFPVTELAPAKTNDGASISPPKAASKTAQAKPAAPKKSSSNKDEVYTIPISISGRTFGSDAQPLAGATVYLASQRPDSKRLAETVSDKEGKYAFKNVQLPIQRADTTHGDDSGEFEVFGVAEGYGLTWRQKKSYYPDDPHFPNEYVVRQPDWPTAYGSADPIELDLQFGSPANVRGRVLDDHGKPIPNTVLDIRYADSSWDQDEYNTFTYEGALSSLNERDIVPRNLKARTVDADGRFEFTGLPRDHRFEIWVHPPGFPTRRIWAVTNDTVDTASKGKDVYNGDIALTFATPRKVPVQIVYADTGKPAPKVFVMAGGSDDTSNGDGRVELTLPDGEYRITLLQRIGTPYRRSEGKLVVSESSVREPARVELQPAAIVDITVVDADTGQPLSGVDLWRADTGAEDPSSHRSVYGYRSWEVETRISHYESRRTDKDGRLRTQFEPGKHRIGVALDAYPAGYEPVEPTGKIVELEAGKAQSIQFQLRKKSQPTGDSETKKNTSGNVSTVSPKAATESTPPGPAIKKAATNDDDEANPAPITISGQAIGKNAQPIAGATIYLASLRPAYKRIAQTVTDKDGKYAFDKVPLPIQKPDRPQGSEVGEFEVFGTADGYGLSWREPKFFNPRQQHITNEYVDPQGDGPRRFGSADAIEMDLRFVDAVKVRGRVVDDHGKPIVGTLLDIRNADSQWDRANYRIVKEKNYLEALNERNIVPRNLKTRTTDRDGNFEFTGLPKNHRFWIWVHPPGFPTRQIWAVTNDTVDTTNKQDSNIFKGDINLVFATPRKVPIEVIYGDTRKPAPKVMVSTGGAQGGSGGTTNDAGLVTATLPDGEYKVSIEPRIGTPYLNSDDKIVVSETSVKKPAQVVLQPAAVADISVVDADTGKPLSGVDLWRQEPSADAPNGYRNEYGYYAWEVETHISHYDKHRTDNDGKMQVFFEPGKHRIGVGLHAHPIGYQAVDTDGKVVGLEAGKPQSIQFQMRPRAGSQKSVPKGGASSNSGRAAAKAASVDIPVVIAKHVMLLNGRDVITWGELDAMIAALADPSQAYPHFYVTHGVIDSGGEKEAKPHMFEIHRKFKLKGHSEGTLAARTSLRYDRIRNQADLVPDELLRVNGVVLDSKEKPVAGAEVVLITPVDDSLSYKAYEIALVEGRLRNRLDDVVTDTDAAGRFAIYPPKGKKYCVLVLHPSAGINIAWDQGLAKESKVHLLTWAALVSELGAEPGAKQTASLSSEVRAQDGYPEINLTQYWSDLKEKGPTNVFGFTHVPPIWQTSIRRDIAGPDGGAMGLNAASVSLLPGESRRIDLGPLSDKQREWLKSLLEESKKRSESSRQK